MVYLKGRTSVVERGVISQGLLKKAMEASASDSTLCNTGVGEVSPGQEKLEDTDPAAAGAMMIDTMDPKTAEKIQAYQSQIKILLHNYQILQKNELNLSEEDVKSNMEKVEKLLLKFSRKQTRLTEKWMSKQRKPEEQSSKESAGVSASPLEPAGSATPPANAEVVSPATPPEASEASTPLDPEAAAPATPPDPEGDDKSGGDSNDGMMMAPPPPAAPRGFRGGGAAVKKGRGGRRGGNGVGAAAAAAKLLRQKQREDEAAAVAAALGLDVCAELVLKPGQYKGDVTEEEMLDTRVTHPDKGHDTEYLEPDEAVVPRDGLTFERDCADDLNQFALNIGLLTPEGTDLVSRQMHDERRVKNNWRNLTYVPEISDLKHRVRYTYLSTEMSSPPLLRARNGGAAGAGGASLHQAQLRGVKSRRAAAEALRRQDSNN